MCNATHSLLVRGKDVMTAFHKMCNITHKQLVIGKNVMHCLSQNMGCHTLPVVHRKRCDDIAHHKMCSVTHNLLVIWKGVMQLSFTKCVMWHTFCWSYKKMRWDWLSQMCNITHSLLVTWKDMMRLAFTKCVMSLTSCHGEKIHWTMFQKYLQYYSHSVHHMQILIRLSFEALNQHDMLTSYFYRKSCDLSAFTNLQYHPQSANTRMCPKCSVAE